MILVVNMNSTICRLYHYIKSKELNFLREVIHPENKLKNIDLVSDRQGHYLANDRARGAYSPRMEPKEVEIDRFTLEVAKDLDKARSKENYEHMILICPAHISGLLYQHISKHIKNLINIKIQKDLVNLSDKELLEFLKTHAVYASEK